MNSFYFAGIGTPDHSSDHEEARSEGSRLSDVESSARAQRNEDDIYSNGHDHQEDFGNNEAEETFQTSQTDSTNKDEEALYESDDGSFAVKRKATDYPYASKVVSILRLFLEVTKMTNVPQPMRTVDLQPRDAELTTKNRKP